MSTAVTVRRMTADEFAQLPPDDRPRELVGGEVVTMNVPYPRHGEICGEIARLLGNHVKGNRLGRVLTNDSGIVTERDPDTVRGADVAYYSFARVPRGPCPRKAYLAVVPEIAVEVWFPFDRWSDMHAKVSEYLTAGVTWVCVAVEPANQVHVFHAEEQPRVLEGDDELMFPDVLPEFRVPVRQFFE